MEKKINSSQEKCLGCGGNLYYNPASHSLFCENCGSEAFIDDNGYIEYHDLHKKYEAKQNDDFVKQNKIFKCPNCGANVILSKYEISQKCPYCSTSLVIQNSSFSGLRPDAIIPFEFDETEASRRFMLGIKRNFWVPNKLKKNFPENQITGIYIPSFGFDASTTSRYSGELYNEYTETDSEGNSQTRREYFSISGIFEQQYQDIMVECSSKITQRELVGFLPYRFEEKKPYNNAYILGYSVEQYDKAVADCEPIYKSQLDAMIRSDILRQYSFSGVSSLFVDTTRRDEKYLYHILPVYRFDYEYRNKKYVTYMNGQTGKVDKNVPKSVAKIITISLLAVLIVLIPLIIGLIIGLGS